MGASALLAMVLVGQCPAYAADAPVGLGTAAAYSVLGGTTVTNTGSTTLAGNLGVNPGSAITGFSPDVVAGATHAADAPALQAQSDLTTAYDDAAGKAMTSLVAGDLVGKTLSPGVYKSSGPLSVSGALTLDGQGDPNSVFIFQVASTLTTASASNIVLTNSAQACNVYWQVASSATLGTASSFSGNILALTSISVTTGAKVQGRALARNGQVSLESNVFTMPGCAAASPSSTTTATAPAPPAAAPATASPSAAAGPASAGTGPRTGRGVNIDTAAETHDSTAGTVLGAAAAAGLVGVWMLTRGRRLFRRNK
ncbi:ice-binding family protein [Arthrobacter sp. PsM3]|uniref:ice-binding family protein n=1 Tax=Arthrobacter sp. PsM3 TaxID=3030531 RepID=UPI00263B14E9|nr:ice-binding family protein [Arthrobacter sp. PsM3]MDN4643070.1 ice-binding family protein [Arthrobacter sp. PsM3]